MIVDYGMGNLGSILNMLKNIGAKLMHKKPAIGLCHDFVSIIQRDHIMGTQFHRKKSHKFGMRLLCNFVERV